VAEHLWEVGFVVRMILDYPGRDDRSARYRRFPQALFPSGIGSTYLGDGCYGDECGVAVSRFTSTG
jgi:hypothetical protein